MFMHFTVRRELVDFSNWELLRKFVRSDIVDIKAADVYSQNFVIGFQVKQGERDSQGEKGILPLLLKYIK